jgi:hypothetical protein
MSRRTKVGLDPRADMRRAIELIAELRNRIVNPFAPVKWTMRHERELTTLASAYGMLEQDDCATSAQIPDSPQDSR